MRARSSSSTPCSYVPGGSSSDSCCRVFYSAPSPLVINIPDINLIKFLPMAPDDAQPFVERRTQLQIVNRIVYAVATIKLDTAGFKHDKIENYFIGGALESVSIFSSENSPQPLAVLSIEDLKRQH